MSYSAAQLASNPAWYLRFGEASGNPQDSSGNARHGSVTGGSVKYAQTGLVSGDTNKAIGFDSVNTSFKGYVNLPAAVNNADDVDQFTIEALVKCGNTGIDFEFISRDASGGSKRWRMKIDDTTGFVSIAQYLADGNQVSFTGSIALNDNVKHHVAARFHISAGSITLFVDGELTNTFTSGLNGTIYAGGSPSFNIGGVRSIAEGVGILDELSYFRTGLSNVTIAAHAAEAFSSPSEVGIVSASENDYARAITISGPGEIGEYSEWTSWLEAETSSGSEELSNWTDWIEASTVVVLSMSIAWSYSPLSPVTGSPVTLDASESSGAVEWNWYDATGIVLPLGSGEVFDVVFDTPGTRTIRLEIKDGRGSALYSNKTFTVTEVLVPAPVASFSWLPASPVTNETVTFDATASTNAVSWSWDDAGTLASPVPVGTAPLGTGQTLGLVFGSVGTEAIRLTVTNSEGVTDSLIQEVVVEESIYNDHGVRLSSFAVSSQPNAIQVDFGISTNKSVTFDFVYVSLRDALGVNLDFGTEQNVTINGVASYSKNRTLASGVYTVWISYSISGAVTHLNIDDPVTVSISNKVLLGVPSESDTARALSAKVKFAPQPVGYRFDGGSLIPIFMHIGEAVGGGEA